MGKIVVKFDPTITHEDITVQLTNSSPGESGDDYTNNQMEVQQTAIYGIKAPLIKINNVVVDFIDVVEFSLKSVDVLPAVTMTIKDRYNLITSFDTPGCDNTLQIQILPPFDNAYKKINLNFYISQIRITNGSYINITGLYKLPALTSSNIKSFGEINTYNLFEQIANETGLGLSSNIEPTDQDKRYIYCDNKSYLELMNREIKFSGEDLQIMEYWIDFWDSLTYADIYERYNATDPDEDMMIWITSNPQEMGEGETHESENVVAALTNSPSLSNSELYISNYSIKNKGGAQYYLGTDNVYSIYSSNNMEYMDYLIQDGDVKKDIFSKYEYLGEYYGEFNYLLADKKRSDFIKKMGTETVEVELKTPLLALMRGNKVNLLIYHNNAAMEERADGLAETGAVDANAVMQTQYEDENDVKSQPVDDGNYVMDKAVSGQYMISASNIKYSNNQWKYFITLSRPASNKTQLLNE